MTNYFDPVSLGHIGGQPVMNFHWQEISGKKRLIGNPNKPMRALHRLYGEYLKELIRSTGDVGYCLRKLPSATGCVRGSNPTTNAHRHLKGKYYYITDLKDAYLSIDLDNLALLIVYLERFSKYGSDISLRFFQESGCGEIIRSDPTFGHVIGFLRLHFSGLYGMGLAVGGPLSPFLMNLYCEVYLDIRLRRLCEKKCIEYTRYVDDLVFSSTAPISSDMRKEIRRLISEAALAVNHRKSRVLALSQGTVFITKVGVSQPSEDSPKKIVFPQRKRRRLRNEIIKYLNQQTDWPEKVSGLIAEFLYYYKNVSKKTATDHKTFALCRAFEIEWAKWRSGPVPLRKNRSHY